MQEFTLVLPLVLLAVMIFFMWRTNKRNQEKQQAIRSSMAPGVEVMTQAGIYGTLVEINSDDNQAIIETTPGTRLRVHSATIVNVIEPTVDVPNVVIPDDASALTNSNSADEVDNSVKASEPDYVETVEPVDTTEADQPRDLDNDDKNDAPKA